MEPRALTPRIGGMHDKNMTIEGSVSPRRRGPFVQVRHRSSRNCARDAARANLNCDLGTCSARDLEHFQKCRSRNACLIENRRSASVSASSAGICLAANGLAETFGPFSPGLPRWPHSSPKKAGQGNFPARLAVRFRISLTIKPCATYGTSLWRRGIRGRAWRGLDPPLRNTRNGSGKSGRNATCFHFRKSLRRIERKIQDVGCSCLGGNSQQIGIRA